MSTAVGLIIIVIILFLTLVFSGYNFLHVGALKQDFDSGPIVNDPHLRTEIVFKGLALPPSMAFLGPDDILVLEKNKGTVQRILHGKMLEEPLLDVNVANKEERGMLGIAVAKDKRISTYVFLYFTQSPTKDGDDRTEKKEPLGNRLYRYELIDNKLVNPRLLLDLPTEPGAYHNGGVVLIGPDNNVYVVVGDLFAYIDEHIETQAINFRNGTDPDGRGGILRITQDGEVVGKGILGDNHPIDKYYAYGIRNSFGIDFDPLTEKLWDTENGPAYGDEINIVEPGFNSGWIRIQGIWKPNDPTTESILNVLPGERLTNPNRGVLTDFNGNGKYSTPEFIWNQTVGLTALKFFDSDKYGKRYENDMFVGDSNNGNLYHFDLNKNRTGLILQGPLDDKIADKPEELQNIIFGKGFGLITDITIGPDGYLYILTEKDRQGTIFRIIPTDE